MLGQMIGLSLAGLNANPAWWVPNDGRKFDLDALNWRMWDSQNGVRTPDALTISRASSRGRRTSLGVFEALADNLIALDHDDAGTALGLQIEPQATYNRVNSSLTGFVAGSPGTAPDGWSISGPGGLTRTLSLITTSGRPKLRVHYAGAPSSNTQILLQTIPSLTLAAASGQVWTYGARFSCGGTGLDGNSLALNHWETDGSNNILRSGAVGGTSPLAHARRSATVTIGASTAYLRLLFGSGIITAGTTCDFWIEIECPTLTQTAFLPSEYLVGTSSAVRYADGVSLPFGSWGSSAAGTLLLEYVCAGDIGANMQIAELGDGTANNRVLLYMTTGGGLTAAAILTGGVHQLGAGVTAGSGYVYGAVRRVAVAWASNSAQVSVDGAISAEDTSVTVPTGLTTLRLGANYAAANLNGWVRRAAYWPYRMAAAEMQARTAA